MIMHSFSFYCSPDFSLEEQFRRQLRVAENSVRHWQDRAARLRSELAEISELKATAVD